MNNVVVVHGSNNSKKEAYKGGRENTRHWFPWLKKKLELKYGIYCSIDLYSNDWNPVYVEYKKIFEENELNENTILVGHSAGCAFILKYLNNNPKKKFKKIILVAPYVFGLPEHPVYDDVTISGLSGNVKNMCSNISIFVSKNDKDYIINDALKITKELESQLFLFEDKGHFCIKQFPELIEQIILE